MTTAVVTAAGVESAAQAQLFRRAQLGIVSDPTYRRLTTLLLFAQWARGDAPTTGVMHVTTDDWRLLWPAAGA